METVKFIISNLGTLFSHIVPGYIFLKIIEDFGVKKSKATNYERIFISITVSYVINQVIGGVNINDYINKKLLSCIISVVIAFLYALCIQKKVTLYKRAIYHSAFEYKFAEEKEEYIYIYLDDINIMYCGKTKISSDIIDKYKDVYIENFRKYELICGAYELKEDYYDKKSGVWIDCSNVTRIEFLEIS